MKRVLVVATTTGYQIRSFGDAARALGVRLVFASDRCDQLDDPWWDQAIPIRFHAEDEAVAAVLHASADVPLDGIVAVGDRPAVLAARLAAALGLRGHPPAAAAASRNKLVSRDCFRNAGLPTPDFTSLPLAEAAGGLRLTFPYPIVIKPLALSGSRGVMRVDVPADLGPALERLGAIVASSDVRNEQDPVHDHVLVESFIPGREFAVEAVLDQGALRVLAIFDKPDPLDGPFFEETIYVTPSRASDSVQARIVEAVARAANVLGLHHGPIHAECRVAPDDARVYVLEVAARPIGGLCARALRFTDGRSVASGGWASPRTGSLEEVLLRHAVGESIDAWRREIEASGVMMIPIPRAGIYRGVSGVEDAAGVAGIEEVTITARPDARLVPLPEGRSYLGFIFARGAAPEQVERSLRHAHARLAFSIDRDITMAR